MNIRKNLSKILMIALLGVLPFTFAFASIPSLTIGHDCLSLLKKDSKKKTAKKKRAKRKTAKKKTAKKSTEQTQT